MFSSCRDKCPHETTEVAPLSREPWGFVTSRRTTVRIYGLTRLVCIKTERRIKEIISSHPLPLQETFLPLLLALTYHIRHRLLFHPLSHSKCRTLACLRPAPVKGCVPERGVPTEGLT